MRTFIALELPGGFADQTALLARALRRDVQGRFMGPETYHVTLAFLGDVGEGEVAGAMAALDAVAGLPAVPLSVGGLGSFGRKAERTLFLELLPAGEATGLAEAVRDELGARGIAFDGKKFVPHVTLARHAKLPQGALPELPFPADAVADRVTLFKSTLSQEGATYKPLYSVELRG